MRAKLINEAYINKNDLHFITDVKSQDISLYNLNTWSKVIKDDLDLKSSELDSEAFLKVEWELELDIKRQGVAGIKPVVKRVNGNIKLFNDEFPEEDKEFIFDSIEDEFEIKVNIDNIYIMIQVRDIEIDFKTKIINVNF